MAVWLHLSYLMPSIAVVAATFTFRDEAADESSVLRRDYHTQFSDSRIRVNGKFGRLRAWLPWSRPKNHGMTVNVSRAEDEKRRAFEQVCMSGRLNAADGSVHECLGGLHWAILPRDPLLALYSPRKKSRLRIGVIGFARSGSAGVQPSTGL
jgi:hypothetical protein